MLNASSLILAKSISPPFAFSKEIFKNKTNVWWYGFMSGIYDAEGSGEANQGQRVSSDVGAVRSGKGVYVAL